MADPSDVQRSTREYYDAIARTYLELFREELRDKPYDLALLDRFAAGLGPGARLCDAGCGPCGHTARHLARSGLRVTGVDLSPRCAALAAAGCPGVPFLAMAMEALGFRDGCFDGVLAYHSVIYTPKAALPALIAELRRVLRPGGRLLVAVKEGDGEGVVPDPLGSGRPTYFTSFREDELRGFVERAGFRCAFAETREPYASEIAVRRIYVLGEKRAGTAAGAPLTPGS